MRFLIAGGGTGGHVIPAIAVAQELLRRGTHEVLLAGTRRGLESRLAPGSNLPLETIEVGALNRVGKAQALLTLLRMPLSFLQARRTLKRFRPDVVYGVGGYASGPVMAMAVLSRIPVVIHEANAVPGFANRVIAPFVSRALVSFPETSRYFKAERVEVTGVPVRPQFFQIPPKQHVPPFTVLVFGGSQGSHRINQAVMESLGLFAAAATPPRFIHQTGAREHAMVQQAYNAAGLGTSAEVLPFIDDMPGAFARADLLLCRSGASTLFEITAAGKASILIPLPTAADDHQLKNARAAEHAGAARVLLDQDATGQSVFDAVNAALPALCGMERRSRAMAKPGAAERIADILERTGRHVL